MAGLGVLRPQPPRAQRRRQRERHEHRQQDRRRRGDAEAVEVAADLAGHERDRHEDDDQRQRRRHDRQADLRGRLDGRLPSAIAPFSSTYRKMFSSTTIASSMTMPVASESASIVMLFSVKPNSFITVNVPMIEVGIASAAMIVDAQVADEEEDDDGWPATPPRIRCIWMSSNDRRMKRDWSPPTLMLDVRRQRRLDPLEPRQDAVDDLDGVGARLLADRHARRPFSPSSRVWLRDLLRRVSIDAADVAERDDRAVPVGEDDLVELLDVAGAGPSCAARFPTGPAMKLPPGISTFWRCDRRAAPDRRSGRRRSGGRR